MPMYHYKTNPETKYAKKIERHLQQKKRWKLVADDLNELLGENITRMVQKPGYFGLDPQEITKEENKKLFKIDGAIRQNTKAAKALFQSYKDIIKKHDLEDYEEIPILNFGYGLMRHSRTEQMRHMGTSEGELYYETDFDLQDRADDPNVLIKISQEEFLEKQLEETRKRNEEVGE
ncbi:hypothetical protein JCM19038_2773 [Geomicrobium sp. JCM 19038]|nr:hypothetical protein JCM19038_2773 [Geomicrobium sp. JCM 19038]